MGNKENKKHIKCPSCNKEYKIPITNKKLKITCQNCINDICEK